MRTCDFVGCDAKHHAQGLCASHYWRRYQTGSVGTALVRTRPGKGRVCSVEGCGRKHDARGFCRKHAVRVRIHGDPFTVLPARAPRPLKGPEHPHWRGDDISYGAAHDRVRRQRGDVSSWPCVGCGRPGQQWSYNYADPAERKDHRGRRYSPDPVNYSPRCSPCHWAFDAGIRAARTDKDSRESVEHADPPGAVAVSG